MRNARGFSIIELLVALTIGTVLIGGAVYVYSQSRRTSTVTESVARMQENGRYVYSVLEPELQLAGLYGFSNQPYTLKFISNRDTTATISAINMQKKKAAITGLSVLDNCGVNFAVDVIATVEGSEDAYPFDLTTCPPIGTYQTGSDTLTVRRSGNAPADGVGTATNGTVQMLANRLSPNNQFVFVDGKPPADPKLKKDYVQVRDMIAHSYYVSVDDTTKIPALRMKTMVSGPAWDDVEIMRGVEDLQVQFGIDTGDYDGKDGIDKRMDVDGDGIPDVGNGVATQYVSGDKVPAGFQVVAVRIWILLRAEQAEQGFVNSQTYKYAGKEYVVNDNFRRVLVSRTIELRNARVL